MIELDIHKRWGSFSLDVQLRHQGGILGLLGALLSCLCALALIHGVHCLQLVRGILNQLSVQIPSVSNSVQKFSLSHFRISFFLFNFGSMPFS